MSETTPGYSVDGHGAHRSLPACAGPRARRAGRSPARRGRGPARRGQAQLAAIQTQRASRERRKRPASPSPDGLLVEEVRGLLTLSVGELATRLGVAYSTVLGKAQETPLSPRLRDKLLALKREHLAAKP